MSKSGPASRLAKLRRVQDLLVAGKPIALPTPEGDVIRLWVAKPSAFERDEAQSDGRSARARKAIAFDNDEDQQAIVEAKFNETPRDELIDALAYNKSNEFYIRATDEVRADKKWQERMVAMDRSSALLDDLARGLEGGDEDARSRLAEEREELRRLQVAYIEEVDKVTKRLRAEFVDELTQGGDESLLKTYRASYRDTVGANAFLSERRVTELYFAVRDCSAIEDESKPGGLDHSGCNAHIARLAEHRHEVYAFPDVVTQAAAQALDDLNMTPQEAAFSDAPTSSSASSERPSEPAESTPSTPVETPSELVGT